ncbi:uncharacterized protein BX664DRAFT_369286 [Halteromyces radiatus]|uniref:uncharacterized protein n=1 Tax=Halteromyces radiatus TaxID=101107 RepID=UPI00221FE404|nr:uncharacterized protein BX664DRAFT_369286 [Halteromyces radiatus]KAI8078883.1 hypothetical protein BX664DRAFT_369286 [Halteromyces radiatus]
MIPADIDTNYTIIVPTEVSKEEAIKRRQIYLRPFLLYTFNSYLAELLFLVVAIVFFSGLEEIWKKLAWTMILCPIGMGGTMGSLTIFFLTDRYYGREAVIFSTILHFLVMGTCNFLCWNLDRHLGQWFGSASHPLWFHLRYPFIFLLGIPAAQKLFTDEGQKELAKWGI